ncbi:hypothetical protein EDE05_101350 [Neorhizobium sp. R1-B]|uniref:hypothetical protein n=1 Tax=Neorhizobium TaxID=1525371 RepID=UPI000CF8E48D|nr:MULTISPECIES: hypothetical protein [Neorhizobium]TCV75945.1 hypothetical protein EDE09_101228 [Neorhizobium sp. S3-V5DH]TDX89036.1 hypothetical protein EDE05_101350 [Neorhizobium sp. R1-B]
MKVLTLFTVALVIPAASYAQAPQQNRFQLERTESGVVRLDTQTGAMTLCREENGTLTCRMQPDERAAYEEELDRLEKRVTSLEERLSQTPPTALPTDEEVDKSLSIMEKFMRRFMAIVGEFIDEREADKPQPNRT